MIQIDFLYTLPSFLHWRHSAKLEYNIHNRDIDNIEEILQSYSDFSGLTCISLPVFVCVNFYSILL